jgi:HemX protein
MYEFLSLGDRSWMWIGSLLYTGGFLFGLAYLARARKHSRAALFGIILAGFLTQTIGLYLRGMEVGSCPLGNRFEIVQFIVWSLILLYMAVGPVYRMSLLGFFSAGLASVLGIVSLALGEWDGPRNPHALGHNVWIELHAALAIFSYGVFAILALTASMYLLQNYSLKRKKMAGLFRFLPSIIQLDQMILRLLLAGVALLTASLVMGGYHSIQAPDMANWAKITVTFGIWLAYLILVVLRVRKSVVAHTLAWTCILLFVVALASVWPVASSRELMDDSTMERVQG